MSNIGLIIEERSRDIGSFLVGRLIPFRKKRMIGPFIFIDHMGPSKVGPTHFLDIGQHPHIGLSTLTYLFEGEIMHRDSIGTAQKITPGSVNWMTAGKGVVHTERTPGELRSGSEHVLHGFQIWVALPRELESMEPEFFHAEHTALPRWKDNEASYTLVAGEAYGKRSPVPVHSELFMVEIKCQDKYELDTTLLNLKGEIGVCIVEGYIEACGERIEQGNLLVSKEEDVCRLAMGEHTHVLLFGGKPFEEERYIFWNFVSSDKVKIEEAKKAWKEKQFKMVDGEKGYIPLPE
ncbi:pirin family protein [Fulvivirga sp. M361]|uniref:pirin family protein n=1 Tax=Fulvivirga sp. M361 TaxID=2594266 RepID=UPI0011798FB2|nr:pirin family protein [Fulvivirga sp. M361]TRX62703.1 pirin family protein [Fulvivirga sp. M361]